NNVAGLCDCVRGLSRHDQPKSLDVTGRVDLAAGTVAMVAQREFAEVHRTSVRRDRPQHVGEVFRSETARRDHVLEFRGHVDHAALTLYFRRTLTGSHEGRSAEIDFTGTTAMQIVHRRSCPFDNLDAIE